MTSPSVNRRLSRGTSAFSLAEQMSAAAAAMVISAIVYALLNAGSIMYSKIVQVNAVHRTARSASEFISSKLYEAVEQPQLLDAAGLPPAAVDAPHGYKADGVPTAIENFKPAEGVLFMRYMGTLMVSAGVDATTATLTVRNMPPGMSPLYAAAPPAGYLGLVQVGDVLDCPTPAFRARVTAVSATGASGGSFTTLNLTLDQAVGVNALPPVVTATPDFVATNTPVQILRNAAFMAVSNADTDRCELRYYPAHLATGDAAFNDRSKYEVLATNLRRDSDGSRPFSYLANPSIPYVPEIPGANFDPAYRSVRVLLQIKAHEHDQRFQNSLNNSFVVNTSVSWKSAPHAQFGSPIQASVTLPTATPAPTTTATVMPTANPTFLYPPPSPTNPTPGPKAEPTTIPTPLAVYLPSPMASVQPTPMAFASDQQASDAIVAETPAPKKDLPTREFPTQLPDSTPVPVLAPTPAPTPRPTPLPTPIPLPTPLPTPTSTPTPTPDVGSVPDSVPGC